MEYYAKEKFICYTSTIKDYLLDQIISRTSNSRNYYSLQYTEISNRYLNFIDDSNYNKLCGLFVKDIYSLIENNNHY